MFTNFSKVITENKFENKPLLNLNTSKVFSLSKNENHKQQHSIQSKIQPVRQTQVRHIQNKQTQVRHIKSDPIKVVEPITVTEHITVTEPITVFKPIKLVEATNTLLNIELVKKVDIFATRYIENIITAFSKILKDSGLDVSINIRNIKNKDIRTCKAEEGRFLFICCPQTLLQANNGSVYPTSLISLPKDKYFLYQLEQLDVGKNKLNENLINLIKGSKYTFDYSEINLPHYPKEISDKIIHLIPPVVEFPKSRLPFVIVTKVCDVLFCGYINSRRESILNELTRAGYNVLHVTNVFGSSLTKLICQSRIFLNIHHSNSKSLETCRLNEAVMSTETHIISERGNCEELYEGRVIFVEKEDILKTVKEVLSGVRHTFVLCEKDRVRINNLTKKILTVKEFILGKMFYNVDLIGKDTVCNITNSVFKNYINNRNLYKAYINYNTCNVVDKFCVPSDLFKLVIDIISKNILKKKIMLIVGESLYPPNGGGENWLLTIANVIQKDYFCIGLCFKDVYNNISFTNTNVVDLDYINIIQTRLDYINITSIINIIQPYRIFHQGHLRLELMKISNVLNVPFITGFCFWNDLIIDNDNDMYINIDMKNKSYREHNKFKEIEESSTVYICSEFMSDIIKKNIKKTLNIIETNNPLIISNNINLNFQRKYVSLFNCHPLKGGLILLYLLKHLNINIPLLGIITENCQSFEKQIIESFNERNKLNNINVLFLSKQENIEEIYVQTKIMLIPSIVDETYCRVGYESTIFNCYILSYKNGNLNYIFDDYNNVTYIENPFVNKYKKNTDITLSNEHCIIWKNFIENLYFTIDNKKTINHDKVELDIKQLSNKLYNIIDNVKTFNKKDTIGFYGPLTNQGLGIQIREYATLLKSIGFDVAFFSHMSYFKDSLINTDEWQLENIFYSKYLRDNTSFDEVLEFVNRYNIKTIIIPEICYGFIFNTISYFKKLHVKVIAIINIEILRADETQYYRDIDIIVANNLSSFNLLKYIFPNKSIELLGFDNLYLKKSFIEVKSFNKIKFSTFGGLNSFTRKNIDKTYNVFKQLLETSYNDLIEYELYIYIQGNCGNNSLLRMFKNTKHINIKIHCYTYNEIIQNINNSDIIIHLGDHEGLGLGIFEALNNNKPVITLNTYPNNELIAHEQNGFLINCSFKELTDNNESIIRQAIVDTSDYSNILKQILQPSYKDKLLSIMNFNKHINNNYKTNFLNILKKD